jgi:hypothetical protein
MFSNFFSKIVPFMWSCGKNILDPDRPQMTIWLMRIACRMPKATNTHSEYVILIAFLLWQWLHERASALRYTCIACLVPAYPLLTRKLDEGKKCSYEIAFLDVTLSFGIRTWCPIFTEHGVSSSPVEDSLTYQIMSQLGVCVFLHRWKKSTCMWFSTCVVMLC